MPTPPTPPVPERRPHVLEAHGDRRVDDWYWLADRDDPAVTAHLEAENAYAEAVLAPLQARRQALYREMVARIAETDLSVPVRRGPWWYYHRTQEGRSYAVHCRRPAAPGEASPLDPGPAADEEVILDENALADGLDYFEVGNLSVSPGHRWLAYATDTTGGERFTLAFRRLGGDPGPADGAAPDAGPAELQAPETVADTYYGLAWSADESTVFYTRVDRAMRPFQLWRHRLGHDPAGDVLVYEEPDERFTLAVGETKDRSHVVLALQSNTTSEQRVVPADDPSAAPRLVAERDPGVEYSVEHVPDPGGDGPGWFVVLTNHDARDFKVAVAPADRPGRDHWRELLAHRPGTRVDDVDVFEGRLVVSERLDAEARVRIVPFDPAAPTAPGGLLAASRLVPSGEHPSTTWEGANPEYHAGSLRYEQTSLVSPRAVYDLAMDGGGPVLRKRQPVLGGYDPSRFRTYRLWAPAPDGTAVPVSVVLRADLLADPDADEPVPSRPAPCVLYGYGAYEHSVDPAFSSLRLSLLERGVIFAIAHVRGGGERGRRWYEDGKLAAKPHSFTDFIACARFLVSTGHTVPERLAARGGSAGGLLMGAVVNRAPELFTAVVAEVPFVDCLTTMLDPDLPLTVGEWEEWGNPVTDPEAYAVMRGYSPYDNVRDRREDGSPVRYPRILATAGLNDPRVGYWEPAKWVARLRRADPAARVVLRTEMGAGHGGPSGRYDAWRDEALVTAFLLDALGVAEDPGS